MNNPNRKHYDVFCGELCNLFDRDWDKIKNRVDSGWNFLNHIPDIAWKPMSKMAVDTWESWPRNWVKAVKDVYETWKRDAGHTGYTGIKYNKDDDIRFPVHLMAQAFNILQTKDYPSYVYFCDQVGMPKTDRDRVENKHRVCSNYEQPKFKLPEIGHRTNRKNPREEIARLRESFVDDKIPF